MLAQQQLTTLQKSANVFMRYQLAKEGSAGHFFPVETITNDTDDLESSIQSCVR